MSLELRNASAPSSASASAIRDYITASSQGLSELAVAVSLEPPPNVSLYDLCLVFPLTKGTFEFSADAHEAMEKIIHCVGRKYIFMYNSGDMKHRFVLIRGGSLRLKSKAEQRGLRMLLDDHETYVAALSGDAQHAVGRIEILHKEEVTFLKPFQYIYAKFVTDPSREHLYARVQGASSLFKRATRIRLLLDIIQDSESAGGANVSLGELLLTRVLRSYFPLHNEKEKSIFAAKLLSVSTLPWSIPIDEVKDYFGEKIGLYFAFLGHMAKWLIVPAVIGAAFEASSIILWNYSRPEIPVFAFFIALWAVGVMEFWKRKEKWLALKWGTLGNGNGSSGSSSSGSSGSSSGSSGGGEDSFFSETVRPAFKGQWIKSFIDGSDIIYYENKCCGGMQRWLLSGTVLLTLLLVAIGAVGGIYVVRLLLFSTRVGRFSQFVASGINALWITLLNIVFRYVARMLTNFENHRTEEEHERSLLLKLFVFCFVNSYTSFYYLAFGARHFTGPYKQGTSSDSVGLCGFDDCMLTLAINLASIFGCRLVIMNFVKLALPFLLHSFAKFVKNPKRCAKTTRCCRRFWCRWCCCKRLSELDEEDVDDLDEEDYGGETKRDENKLAEPSAPGYSPAELEFRLPVHDSYGLVDHYTEQVVVFGYMTLFISALPGASLLGLITYMIELKGDAWLLLNKLQRPFPGSEDSIGLWKDIFALMAFFAVITNAGLVVFTMRTLEHFTMDIKLAIFIGFQYVVFTLQFLICKLVPDEPREVAIQRQRAAFLEKKLILKVPDSDLVDPQALL